jgi:hypothetical protein
MKKPVAPAIPSKPKAATPTSVFPWLAKHFGAKRGVIQQDSNPYSDYIEKEASIDAKGRAALTKHLRDSSDWIEREPLLFAWGGMTIDLRKRGRGWEKYLVFTCPKRAKPRTIPYYD